jgi:outer membrane protein OmpA-like peptidoglycan-associated protein
MIAFRSRSSLHVCLLLPLSIAFAILHPALCSAQENSAEPEMPLAEPKADAELKADAEGCSDLSAFPRLTASVILECSGGESYELNVPLKPGPSGYARQKNVRGSYEYRGYQIFDEEQEQQAFENLSQLFSISGFVIKYSENQSVLSGRKENTWIVMHLSGAFYNVTLVNEKEEPWTPIKTAEEIGRQIRANYRAAIYGIQFSPDGSAVVEENSKMLEELLKFLKSNPKGKYTLESHKMSDGGTEKDDLEITGKQAQVLVAWLEAHGVAPQRLQAKGAGRSKPLTENDTPAEIERNERIELVETAAR